MTKRATGGKSSRPIYFFAIIAGFLISTSDLAAETVIIKGQEAHPTQVLAKLKSLNGIHIQASAAALSSAGVTIKDAINLVPGLLILDSIDPASASISTGKKPDRSVRAQRLVERLERLRGLGLFEYVEPDYIRTISATPSDAAFVDGTLWGLRNLGQQGGLPGTDIGATTAWDSTTGSTEVIVAVIDTGIRYTHQDLRAQMWRNPGEIPGNGIDDDGDGYIDNVFGINAITGSGDPMDDNGHGTHVAGTIGAAANDGHPHVGVAWNVRLMGCKFLGPNGGKTSDEIKCIEFAVSKGAKIINASYGGSAFSQAQYDAIARARDRGVLFVAAAGNATNNNDLNPAYPASLPLNNLISVAAFDRFGQLANFSNFGQTSVHLAAPGVEIFSSWHDSDHAYKSIQGTSMAAPHVSGVAALVISKFPNLTLTEWRNQILNTTVSVPAFQSKMTTGGRVNAFNALTAIADGNLELSVSPPSGSSMLAGSRAVLTLEVADLVAVTNALVSATIAGSSNVLFVNNGFAPDTQANDAFYTGTLDVPPFEDSVTLTFSATAPGKNPASKVVTYPIVQPALNNDFAKRENLTGTNIAVTGVNLGASKQPGEPNHVGNSGGKSVWWSWTAPNSGTVFISTAGSTFDTLLAVYTGSSLATLAEVAANDDDSTVFQSGSSLVFFEAVGGTTYQIAVDGFGGASGQIALQLHFLGIVPPPPNDNFVNREWLGNFTGTLPAGSADALRNLGAGKEVGEPNHAGNSGGRSVWYSWTPAFTGLASVSTARSNFDTLLAVYTGASVSTLCSVAANDDTPQGGTTSYVEFVAFAGVTYHIAVDGYDGATGLIGLNINLGVPPSRPPNDGFANRSPLAGTTVTTTGSNNGATKEAGEPNHAGNTGGKSVWWSWTAPNSGAFTIHTTGSSFDTLLAVYTGSSVSSLTHIASNDDDAGNKTSRMTINVAAGTVYQIAVDGYRGFFGSVAEGSISLSIASAAAPPNDNFAARIAITGSSNIVFGANLGASKQSSEPNHAGNAGGRSVWWTWTAPSSGTVTISTSGSTFDTLLAVYSGAAVNSLTLVAANDDDPNGGTTSRVTFNAERWTPLFGPRNAEIKLGFQAPLGLVSLFRCSAFHHCTPEAPASSPE